MPIASPGTTTPLRHTLFLSFSPSYRRCICVCLVGWRSVAYGFRPGEDGCACVEVTQLLLLDPDSPLDTAGRSRLACSSWPPPGCISTTFMSSSIHCPNPKCKVGSQLISPTSTYTLTHKHMHTHAHKRKHTQAHTHMRAHTNANSHAHTHLHRSQFTLT